jgi:hypothetical protein
LISLLVCDLLHLRNQLVPLDGTMTSSKMVCVSDRVDGHRSVRRHAAVGCARSPSVVRN